MRSLIAVALLSFTCVANAQTPATALEKARHSTFRVDAAGCKGSDRHATGFLWIDGVTVVTALHAVAGCTHLMVHSEILKKDFPARLTHSLNSADLATLQLAAPIANAPPLAISTQKPAVHDELTVLGYPLILDNMDSTEVKVKFGGSSIREIVPRNTQEELETRRSPSLDLEITSLEGNLAPGTSGAPIMDKAGRVVAIGDGGLENGTVGMAWGVPAVNLTALAQSHETPSTLTADPHLFAAETDVHPTGDAVTCGAGSFIKVRTLEYSDILHSTDDAEGLARLLSFFAVLGIDPSALRYDIYQDANAGGAIAIPEGKTLFARERGCTVDVTPNMTMYVQMTRLNTPADMYPASLTFERAITPIPQWQPDPNFTYLVPRRRADGLTVERKVLLHASNNYGRIAWDQGGAYETLAAKGNWLIGTTALNRLYSPATLQFAQQCSRRPNNTGCDDFRQRMRILVQTVIAAHLTTFPNN